MEPNDMILIINDFHATFNPPGNPVLPPFAFLTLCEYQEGLTSLIERELLETALPVADYRDHAKYSTPNGQELSTFPPPFHCE